MISYIRYDSPGSDTGTNLSLNAEYVIIKNTTTTARVITGWTLRDKTGYTFRFPTFTLKAGASVTVHTGKGTPSTTHQYYGKTWYVWNNTGDAAYLRNAAGTLVHSVHLDRPRHRREVLLTPGASAVSSPGPWDRRPRSDGDARMQAG